MNKNAHRLVYSRLRGMVVAVAETTTAEGKSASGEARRVKRSSGMRAAAVLATSAVAGTLSTSIQAQIVGAGPSAPAVIQTPNGLPQVNINKPGGGGVSVNTYNQFDVQEAGAILNNSATMVQTQLGGWINGNPNFGPNDAARVIVNQVNSPNPSQIRGALEIAGARAELVLANPSGIYLDGAGFINTSRATLTTGVPFYGADGSLAGYNVNRGLVTVAGAGLNASNLDQVDIISRAVQANAAIYAKNLNVIAGANQVNHDTLAATPIAGDGPAPTVAIDVAQLGGMYADRVFLVGNSAGVGVANAGTIAAQAGDLTLQSNGRLVLTGKTTASGNLALSAANGIQNSGTTYAQQSLLASIGTDLTNSGTLAAQQNTSVNAGSVNSTGTLGAGVNNDGAVGQGGDLNLTASGQLSATGQNAAGGNASLTGVSVNLAGSQTTANGNLSLNATAGDVNLSSATTSAHGTVNAKASGTVINDHGSVSSGGSMTLTGANLSNHGGTITQYGSSTMGMNVSGTLDNSASGVIQTNATDLTLTPAELDNAGGTITHGGIGMLTIAPGTGANAGAGALNNASGTIVTKGQAIVQAAGWNNAGGILAAQRGIDATISGHLNNAQGLLRSDASLSLTNGGALSNQGGQISSTHDLAVAAATLQGGGTYSATHDANVHLQGDYTAASDTQFNVGHDLAFTLPGTFTNNANLQSVNTLSVDAGNIVNAGTLTAGGLLHTQSTNLTNTGALVGASASLNATNTISNLGPTALIGASDSNGTLDILARDIENRDDTTATDSMATTAIFGMGKVVLAGGKDASGRYTNAALVNNVSALIQSGDDMELHADKVTSTRRVMKTSTSQIDPASLAQFGIPISGRTGQINVKDPDNIGGVYTEPPHGGQWNSDYQFTTYYADSATATTVTDLSPAAQIVSGGKIDASSVGTLQNYWSNIAAVGDIKMPARYDADGWAASGQKLPGVTVSYSGQYHYNNYDNTEHDWQLPFGNAPFVTGRPGSYTQAAPASIKDYTLPGYFSTLSSNGTISGTGASVNNTAGNASIPPLGLLPGQSVPGLTPTKLNGNASGAKSGASSVHGGPSAPLDPILASATALNVLNNLTIPQGGLFKPTAAPNASYVIETNPAFTNQKNFISSDYFFSQIGVDLTHIPKRLGDGFYEQQLVRNQVTSLTGKAVLGPYADLQTMYESLMAAGADLSKSLDLPIGASLSADQVAKLTSNVILMETRVVDGQSVLVPVVYLAQASQQNMNGPLIAATNIDLQNAQSFTNSGTIKADNTLAIQGKQIDNAFGALQSGGLMALSTENNIDLTSANVKASSLQLDAGKDLILDTATKTNTRVSRDGSTSVVTTLGPTAKLDVAGDASITTGGNFRQNAGKLSVGGNLGMNVGGNWDLGVVQTGEHKIVQRANGVSNTDINKVTGSSVSVGGQSSIGVGGDLTARGAQIDLGQGGTLAAKGTVTLGTASATSTVNSNSSGSDSHGSYAETLNTSDQALTGTTLKGGDTVNIVSGKDITLSGSAISLDKGNANLLAAGDVNVGAATETHALNSHETHSHSNVVSGSKVASGVDQTVTYSQGSTISADGVTVTSGRDINVTGSNIVGTNDVSLLAARDVNIKTSQDTIQSSTYFDKKETGLMSNGGLSVSVGSRSNSDKQQSSSVTNNGSAIGALNGNLTVSAGNDLHATGSILHAGNDVNLAGKTVKIDAATDTSNFAEQQQFRQAGVTVGVTNPVVAAVQTGRQMTNAAQSVGGDPRLIALAAATTGLAAKNTYDSLKQMGGDPVKAATSVGINVSVGASKNDSQMQARSNTAVGSTVSAGRNVTIAAAGAGKDSNIDVIGSTISAGNNAKLAAEGNVNLQAAENTSSQHSTNSGASASVGVSFTVGDKSGVAFTAGVAGNRGNADGDSSTWTNTHVSAGNEFVIQSGGDTNLKGAVASGKQVVADVGGNLNIESLQDKDHYDSKQQSAGISASVCAPPLCTGKSSVAGSIGQTKMNSDYASVIEQSGIKAGDGGFQVDVKGNTDLKGGVVASSDKAVQDNLNKLTTSTLTHSDIEDHASYDASSVGLSGGYGGTIGKDQKGTATNVNPVPGTTLPKGDGGLQVAPPVALSASGDANSTTRSGISGAAITIADGAKQQKLTGQTAAEAVSSINRDTSNTGSALAPIFDKDKIQAGFDITSQFINQAGTFVANRVAEADAAKAAANNSNLTPEQRAAAQQRADELSANWGPNGTYRQVLTALSVAAGGNVTGGLGQFAQNATVAYLQELGTNQVKQIADKLGSEEARAALHAIVGCAGAAASSQSCGAGAMGAATSSVLGSLLAPSANLSASEREARANLVASLVAGVAAVSGQNVATATGAGKIEVENNQVSPMAPVPGWLAGFKLPGYKGEQSGKGDGVIADPATALDSTIKPTGSLIYPMPDAKTVGDWITAIIPDQAKGLVDYIFTAAGGNKVFDTTDASAPPNMSPNGAGRSGAFNEAKRAAGIPVSQQPSAVYPNTDKRSNPQPGYQYEYTIPALGGGTQTVIIRDDADGHYFGEGNAQNRGPHFNDPAGNHYDY
ncbi:hemagglutinin repeat-containing protein [Burkholderia gladioli]|uniref:hemagglutinin repeat-containing protein n=2 Tax=Burkholderia gladioli TaxID=28095 RepID=UPI001640AC59|nr:hemagglutinin repeat-containing protein [Burkholderia gladioli]